jgi:hypothetical protein
MKSQPLIYVKDVEVSSKWYCTLLGADSGHGGGEYERIMDPKRPDKKDLYSTEHLLLQLHSWEEDHHHGTPGDRSAPVGNGLLLWFLVDDFDEVVKRATKLKAPVVTAAHLNPNAQQWEMWVRDPDGYVVVVAGAPQR